MAPTLTAAALIARDESTFSPPHTMLRIVGVVFCLGLTLLLYDLAFGPAFRDRPDRYAPWFRLGLPRVAPPGPV